MCVDVRFILSHFVVVKDYFCYKKKIPIETYCLLKIIFENY